MHLTARLANADDLASMLRLCRNNGEPVESNEAEWRAIWANPVTAGVVVDDLSQSNGNKGRAIMVTTVVTDEFLEELRAAKDPYVLSRLASTPNACVTPDRLGHLNAGDGMNLLICYMGWEGDIYHVAPAPNLRAVLVNAYADRHGGHRLKWLFGEVGGPALLDLTTKSGCRILNDYQDWAVERGTQDAPKRPYLMGVSRENVLQIENQWMTRMFTYFPPVFHFTESQRQILILAREGFTDSEIGEALEISSDAVKKRWSGVYDRVTQVFPGLLPESPLGGRGAEKRRALIAHLRERPEELRAYTPNSR